MDIATFSTVISQPKTQTESGKAVTKTAIDTVKEYTNKIIEKKQNVAVDSNLGQNIDVTVGKQMDAKAEQKKQTEQEMLWMQKKQKMLYKKEVKMLQMREIEQQAMQVNSLTPQDLAKVNDRISSLAQQVSAINADSSRTKDGKVL